MTLDSIEDALQAVRNGEILVVVDDMDRENEGDLIIAASQCTTEKMAWIVKWSRWVGRHCSGREARAWPPPPLLLQLRNCQLRTISTGRDRR